MRFGEFPVYDALGVELAYPVTCQGKVFPAGHAMTANDLRLFRQDGIQNVVGCLLTSDDIRPDIACDMILKSLVGDHLRYTHPENGYSEIYADKDGLFVVSPERLFRFNAHDENISTACLAPFMPVYKNQLIASLRLSGPAFPADVVNAAVDKITGQGPLFKIAPYALCRIGYVQTVMHRGDIPVLEEDALNRRFGVYGFGVVHFETCAHQSEHVEKAVRNAIDAGAEVVLVQSPAAPISRNDVVPSAFKEAAGDIDRLGWPMDPGLSVVIGHKNDVKLIGFAEKDFETPAMDRLMRFLATRSLPPAEDFPSFAPGSLSIERLIQIFTPDPEKNSIAGGALDVVVILGIVVLAAGSSRRMIGSNKLLENVQGLPMIERVVQSALLSRAAYVLVVTGYDARFIEQRLANYDVKIVRNPDYSSGVLSSVRLGLSVLPPDVAGAVVLPADMPGFTSAYIDRLIDCFDAKAKRKPVCMPVYDGVRHNPVLWPRDLFKTVKIIPEDAHWMPPLIEHSDYIVEMPVEDDLPLSDINTHGDLSAFLARADFSDDVEKELAALEKKE